MKNLVLFSIILILPVCSSFCQEITGNISGIVLDNVSNEPLPYANVILTNIDPPAGVMSDKDGRFLIKNIPVGTLSIRISFMGYQTHDINNLSLKPGKDLQLKIYLEEKIYKADEVTIKGHIDKTKTRNTMTSVSSRGFTIEETKRYAGSLNDIARMASGFAGVQVESDGRNDIIIRANSPSGLLWRLEGVDIPNPNHFGAFGSTGGPISLLNNNQLDNSDFLTGAFPAEYGNAVSGVFDLSMRSGNTNNYEFMGQLGFNGFELGAEGPLTRKKASSFMLNYRLSTLELFKILGVDFGTGVAVPKYQDFTFKINLPSGKAGKFSFFGIGGKSQVDLKHDDFDSTRQNTYFGQGYNVINRTNQIVLGMTHIYRINETSYTRLNLAYTFHDFVTETDSVDQANNILIPDYRNIFRENKIHASFFYKKKLGPKANFKTGLSTNIYFHYFIDSVYNKNFNQFTTLTDYRGTSSLIQPYISWQIKPSEDFTFNLGLHYQFYTYNSTSSLEPRLGAIWHFAERSSLNLGYGLHSQVLPITIYNKETYLNPGYNNYNEKLEMLKSHHIVLSYNHSFNDFLRLKTELYYQYIFNAAIDAGSKNSYSILNQGANFYIPAPDSLKSAGTGNNYGLELTMEHFLNKGMYFLATFSLFDSKYKGSNGIYRNTAFNGNYIANLLFGKEFEIFSSTKGKTKKYYPGFDIKLNYRGGQRHSPIDTTCSQNHGLPVYIDSEAFSLQYPDYFRIDLKLSVKIFVRQSNMEFLLDVQNLFNRKNIYNESYDREKNEIYYNYQIGRLIIPQFKIEF